MGKLLIIFLLFVLPLLIFPIGASQFETPKVITAEIAIEALVFFTLLRKNWLLPVSRKYLLLLAALFILTLVHLLFLRTNTSFFGNPFRLQGVFLLWHLIAFSIISATHQPPSLPGKYSLLPLILLGVTVLLFGTNPAGRAIGTLGEPNFLAATAIFFWPFTLGKQKWMTLLAIILAGAIVLVSGSRSGLIALSIQLIFLGLANIIKIPLKVTTLVCLALLACTLILPLTAARRVYEDRAEIWQTAFQAGLSRPLIGHGFGNLEHALKEQSIKMYNNVHFQYVDSSHNIFLDYFVSGGVIALVILIVLIAISFAQFIRVKKSKEIAILLGVLAVMLFNPVSVATLMAFWYLIGQGARKMP